MALVVAWGFLVRSAIDFGTMARGGDSQAWAFLGISSVGAAACLFLGLLLLVRLLRAMGVLRRRTPSRHGSSKHAR